MHDTSLSHWLQKVRYVTEKIRFYFPNLENTAENKDRAERCNGLAWRNGFRSTNEKKRNLCTPGIVCKDKISFVMPILSVYF